VHVSPGRAWERHRRLTNLVRVGPHCTQGVFSQGLHMTKADYNEWGPSFIHTRPFKDA
jgi:hypothetical protein